MELENKFYPNRFLKSVLYPNLIIYFIWAFVKMSLTEPLIQTFLNNEGRALFVFVNFMIILIMIPHWYPFEKKNQS